MSIASNRQIGLGDTAPQFPIDREDIVDTDPYTPASNLGYLAPPGQFFMGAKLFIGTPWMGNEGVLKKNLVWAM